MKSISSTEENMGTCPAINQLKKSHGLLKQIGKSIRPMQSKRIVDWAGWSHICIARDSFCDFRSTKSKVQVENKTFINA